jgi:hypothetical protein
MFEYRHKNRKYIIIEVADIFYAQNKPKKFLTKHFNQTNTKLGKKSRTGQPAK